ncbi:MAG TPA: STAS domain-containing protein [Holophaga sp.]|nr:STAS domain-containing protein [Holophaga sp.]
MELNQTDDGIRLVLGISGKCTVEHAEALREGLLAAVSTGKALALDISEVQEADVTFLQLLLSTAMTLQRSGATLERVGPASPAALSAARVSGFDQTPQLTTFFADEGRDG